MKKKKGFTLIELLVVVAIIGLLSAVVLVSLNSARRSAYDAKRKADLKQMANAFEMYYDTYSYYPNLSANGNPCSVNNCFSPCNNTVWSGTGLNIANWLSTPPLDPVNDTTRCYLIPSNKSSNDTFCIIAKSLQATNTAYFVAHNGAGTTTAGATQCP